MPPVTAASGETDGVFDGTSGDPTGLRLAVDVLGRAHLPADHGVMLVAVESAYTVTDPPLKFLRRHIPPLRLGGIALDLAFMLLLLIMWLLIGVVGRL
jgi:hypothetical protein